MSACPLRNVQVKSKSSLVHVLLVTVCAQAEHAALVLRLVLSVAMSRSLTGGAAKPAANSPTNLEQIRQHYVGLLNLIMKETHKLESELQRLL